MTPNEHQGWKKIYILKKKFFVFTALNGMQTRSSDENSVFPSVCASVTRVNCDKTVERSDQIFYIIRKII